jgi:hypothetical protein
MKRNSPAVALTLSVAAALGLILAGCRASLRPSTHTGDPLEPPWVMNPDLARGAYPGPYIFAAGLSQKGIADRMVARRQAEANARNAISSRLAEVTSDRVINWTRNQKIDDRVLSSSEIRTMSSNVSVGFLSNCDIVEYWVSQETGEYAALARLPASPAMMKMRGEINEILTKRLKEGGADEGKAAEVLLQSYDREMGIVPEGTK